MRILMAIDAKTDKNPFVSTLVEGLWEHGCSVDVGIDKFWRAGHKYDIIHIHWPNSLFRNWSTDENSLINLKERIITLKEQKVKILYTKHNDQAHYSGNNEVAKIYQLIEDSADAIVHLGDFSYHNAISKVQAKKENYIVPHHLSFKTSKIVSKNIARKRLQIPDNSFVILAFGAFRNKDEAKLILNSFEGVNIPNKFLLVPHLAKWFGLTINPPLFSKKWFRNRLLKKKLLEKSILVWDRFVKDNLVPYFFGASDLVVIQRLTILNSGNLPLAYQFKKAVIGPNKGNVDYIIRETENYIFNDVESNSLVDQLIKAYSDDLIKLGEKNYKYAQAYWNVSRISKMYMMIYDRLLNRV